MSKTASEQTVADEMYRYFSREWGDRIRAAIGILPRDVAQNQVALLLAEAYLCGVRDGDGFGMETLAREAGRAAGAPSALLPGLDHMRGDGRNMELHPMTTETTETTETTTETEHRSNLRWADRIDPLPSKDRP